MDARPNWWLSVMRDRDIHLCRWIDTEHQAAPMRAHECRRWSRPARPLRNPQVRPKDSSDDLAADSSWAMHASSGGVNRKGPNRLTMDHFQVGTSNDPIVSSKAYGSLNPVPMRTQVGEWKQQLLTRVHTHIRGFIAAMNYTENEPLTEKVTRYY